MPKNNEKNSKQDVEIAVIKTEVSFIKKEISDIKNNHLNSIYNSLNEIKDDLSRRPTWLITGVVSLLAALIAYLLTK